MQTCDRERYMRLVRERPELFRNGGELTVITDETEIDAYERATGRHIGVAYESSFSLLAVDLVRDRDGRLLDYERLIPARTGAVVCAPRWGDRFVLLRQYRHAFLPPGVRRAGPLFP